MNITPCPTKTPSSTVSALHMKVLVDHSSVADDGVPLISTNTNAGTGPIRHP